jgi:signal transduction histidine kinase
LRDGTGFEVIVDADPVDDLLDSNERLVLYRVVQEALANAARHSGARSATVALHRAEVMW